MDIKYMYRLNKRLKPIRAWYFLLAAIIFGVISVHYLRQNNFTMIRLRDAVITADQQNGDVEVALQNLRKFVYGHMNTDLSSGRNAVKPPIQLKSRYDRLASAEAERIKQENARITSEGEAICGQKFPAAGYNAPRVACVQDYVAANAKTTQNAIPEELYKFDFVSPSWSPDLAGWTLVLSILSLSLFVLRFLVGRILKHYI